MRKRERERKKNDRLGARHFMLSPSLLTHISVVISPRSDGSSSVFVGISEEKYIRVCLSNAQLEGGDAFRAR